MDVQVYVSHIYFINNNAPKNISPGYDLITAEVATQLPKKALLLLTYIYNSMLRLSYFPTLWKFSIIIMIPKPGNPSTLLNHISPLVFFLYFQKYSKESYWNVSFLQLKLAYLIPSLDFVTITQQYIKSIT